MIRKPIRLHLDAARDMTSWEGGGDYVAVLAVSSPHVRISVAFDGHDGVSMPMGLGSEIRGLRFDKLYVSWDAQPGEWIDLAMGEATAFARGPLSAEGFGGLPPVYRPEDYVASAGGKTWFAHRSTTQADEGTPAVAYTVPAGKTLLIQHLEINGGTNTYTGKVGLYSPTGVKVVEISGGSGGSNVIPRQADERWLLSAGWTVRFWTTDEVSYACLCFNGILSPN